MYGDYNKIIKALTESIDKARRRNLDDYDIIERASVLSMIPRREVKDVYDRLLRERKEKQRKIYS
jgi:hypothetical protein